jgi:WD40 repeat protein
MGKSSGVAVLLLVLLAVPPVMAQEAAWTYSTMGTRIGGVSLPSDGSAIAVGAEKVLLFSGNGELLAKEPYGEDVLFIPGGGYLVSSFGSSLYFFRRNMTGTPLTKLWDYEVPGRVRSLDISDDGRIIAAAADPGGTYIFSSTGKMTGGNANYSAVVRVSGNGQRILGVSAACLHRYSSSGEGFLYKNVSIISQPDVLEMTGNGATTVFNDDQRLLSINTGNGAERWKTRATADITALAMSASGTRILVGTQNGDVDLFDDKGSLVWKYATNPAGSTGTGVRDVALSTDGKIAAAGTYEGTIVVLDAAGKEIWSNVTRDHINHIAMSGDGSLVVAAGDETVYAFSSSARPVATSRSPTVTAPPVPPKNTTAVPATPVMPAEIRTSQPLTQAVTSVPTTYSVIRTATQSPVPAILPLAGMLGALLLFMRKR